MLLTDFLCVKKMKINIPLLTFDKKLNIIIFVEQSLNKIRGYYGKE